MSNGRIRNPFNSDGNQSSATQPSPQPGVPRANTNPNFSNGLKPLSPQQSSFVSYYIIDFKATSAAEKAGYNRQYGANLLQMPNIQDAIRREINRRNRRIEITQDAVLEELALVAFADLASFFDDFGKGRSLSIKQKADLTPEQRRMMASISESYRGGSRTIKFRVHDKMKALNMLAQYMGILDGSGRQVDPLDMVQRMREAAANAESTMPTIETEEV